MLQKNLMFIGPCIVVIVEEWKTNLMSLAILFHFLCAQHVSDINISIIRSLRLFCRITTLVVLFLVRCVLDFRCGWVGVVSVLQAYHQEVATILSNHHIGCIVLSSMCVGSFGVVGLEWCPCCRLKLSTRIPLHVEAFNMGTTPTHPHRNSNTHWTINNTTNVVIR